ncbi:hypothetical protein MRX96_018658 [Rhipicephalus microplus]
MDARLKPPCVTFCRDINRDAWMSDVALRGGLTEERPHSSARTCFCVSRRGKPRLAFELPQVDKKHHAPSYQCVAGANTHGTNKLFMAQLVLGLKRNCR